QGDGPRGRRALALERLRPPRRPELDGVRRRDHRRGRAEPRARRRSPPGPAGRDRMEGDEMILPATIPDSGQVAEAWTRHLPRYVARFEPIQMDGWTIVDLLCEAAAVPISTWREEMAVMGAEALNEAPAYAIHWQWTP